MKNKLVLGILITLIIISGVFIEVNSASINNATSETNIVKNKVEKNVQNKVKENSSNTAKTKENTTAETVKDVQNSLNKIEKSKETTSTSKKENKEADSKEKVKEEKKESYVTEDDLIYSNKYLVKEKVIYRIEPKTSIKEFRKNIEIAKGQEIKIYKGKEEVKSGYIGTGMLIKGESGEEYKVSVIGDITGDGIANQIELTKIIRHIIKQKDWQLKGIEKASSDIDGDGKTNLVDITKLINYIVYGKWEHEGIKTPKEPQIKVLSKKEEGKDYYVNEVEIKIEGNKEEKVKYKIAGDKEQKETEIKEEETIKLTGEGKYIITAYSYGKAGNRSRGSNKEITIKELVPSLSKENTTIIHTPTEWTNLPVIVKIETELEGYTIQYSKDGKTWKDYMKDIEVEENGEIYVRLRDEEGRTGEIVKEKIENIDKLEPKEVTITRITQNTNSIEIEAEATDQEATEKDGQSGIAKYYFSKDGGETWEPEEGQEKGNYTFKELAQNKEYKIVVKAEDKAGNSKKTEIKKVTTGKVPEGTGNIEIKQSEEKWTNKNVKIEISQKAGEEYKVEYSKDGITWKEYTEGTEIEYEENGETYARLKDTEGNIGKEVVVKIENIDKVLPTVALEPNGGANYTIPSEENAKIATTITAIDPKRTETNGQSGLDTLQYAWSKSSEEEPTEWTNFTNGSKVEKADIAQPGTWYLWTKVTDKAGNRAEEIKVSNAFTIGANTDEANQIILIQSPTAGTWTNGNVVVTANYGANLSQKRTLICDGTEGTDYTINGIKSVEVKTNGKTVMAEAEDIAGNIVSKTITISNIDKIAPTVNAEVPTNWGTENKRITVSGTDADSGVAGYYVGTTNTTPAANAIGWSITTTYLKGAGTYYVWSKDNVGNISAVNQITVGNIDTTAPIIELSANSNEAWAKSVEVTVTLKDNESGLAKGAVVKYGWSTSPTTVPASYTTASISSYNAGAHTATFTATKNTGTGKYYLWVMPETLKNVAGASQSTIARSTGTFYIDNTAPTMNSLTATTTSWTNNNVTLSGKGIDDQSGIVAYLFSKINNITTASENWTEITATTIQVAQTKEVEENGTWYFYVKDVAGNISKKEIEVRIDKLEPKDFTVEGTSTENSITITGNTIDNEETIASGSSGIKAYYYSIDNGETWLPENGMLNTSYTFNNLKGGTNYILKMKAVDNAGNETITEAIAVKTKEPAVKPQIGDYVNYEPDEVRTPYLLERKYSGYSNQSIQQEKLTWQVLKVHEDGRVDLIGSPTIEEVFFGGMLGYNNGVYLLHDMCKELYSKPSKGIEARSVSLEDFEDEENGGKWKEARDSYIYDGVQYGKTRTYTGYYDYYPNLYARENGSGIDTETTKIDGIKVTAKGYEIPTEETYSKASNKLIVTQTFYEITINEENYGSTAKSLRNYLGFWVASRYVLASSTTAQFGLQCGRTVFACSVLCDSNLGTQGSGRGFRPVVSLGSNVQLLLKTQGVNGAPNTFDVAFYGSE